MAVADGFHVDSNGNLWLGSNRETFDATTRSEAPFYVYANGNMVANSGTFAGTLSSGISISAPVITGGSISGTSGSFTGSISGASGTFTGDLSGSDITGGTIDIGSGTFTVDSVGAMVATSATITGSITSTSGTIGGWTIGSTDLSAGNISIDSGGTISANYSANTGWKVEADGDAFFNKVDIRIGGASSQNPTTGFTTLDIGSAKLSEFNDDLWINAKRVLIYDQDATASASSPSLFLFATYGQPGWYVDDGQIGRTKLYYSNGVNNVFHTESDNTYLHLDGSGIQVGTATGGNSQYIGKNSSGSFGWHNLPSTGGAHADSDHSFDNYGSWTLKRSGSTVGNLQSGYGASWNAGTGLSVSSNSSPFEISYSVNFGTGNTQVARGDHGHIGTGISSTNNTSVGFFNSYTFNQTTGDFSVSTTTSSSSTITVGNLFPNTTNGNLGFPTSNSRWKNIYLQNSPNVSSDERKKENIEDLIYGLDYIKSLEPKSFKMKDREDEAINFGFIAQDLYTTPPEPNIDIALVEYTEDSDDYGVRYTELIAPLVKAVQELSAKNDELQSRIEELEG